MYCPEVRHNSKIVALGLGTLGIAYSAMEYFKDSEVVPEDQRIKAMVTDLGEVALMAFVAKQLLDLIEYGACDLNA